MSTGLHDWLSMSSLLSRSLNEAREIVMFSAKTFLLFFVSLFAHLCGKCCKHFFFLKKMTESLFNIKERDVLSSIGMKLLKMRIGMHVIGRNETGRQSHGTNHS